MNLIMAQGFSPKVLAYFCHVRRHLLSSLLRLECFLSFLTVGIGRGRRRLTFPHFCFFSPLSRPESACVCFPLPNKRKKEKKVLSFVHLAKQRRNIGQVDFYSCVLISPKGRVGGCLAQMTTGKYCYCAREEEEGV